MQLIVLTIIVCSRPELGEISRLGSDTPLGLPLQVTCFVCFVCHIGIHMRNLMYGLLVTLVHVVVGR